MKPTKLQFKKERIVLNEKTYEYFRQFGNTILIRYIYPNSDNLIEGLIVYPAEHVSGLLDGHFIYEMKGIIIYEYCPVEFPKDNPHEEWWIESKSIKITSVDDIPPVPVLDKDKLRNFYIPILEERGIIPKRDLVEGQWYEGKTREGRYGQWNLDSFVVPSIKSWSKLTVSHQKHYEDNAFMSDAFIPFRKLTDEEVKKQIWNKN